MARQAVDKAQRQIGERARVEVDHGELLGAVELGGGADQAEAGVVDDEVRLKASRAKLVGDHGRRVALDEVGRDDLRPRQAARFDRTGQLVELRRAPRHQHQLVPVRRKVMRQRGADAGRRAGDQCDGFERGHVTPL